MIGLKINQANHFLENFSKKRLEGAMEKEKIHARNSASRQIKFRQPISRPLN
jgi:hypothetical protein